MKKIALYTLLPCLMMLNFGCSTSKDSNTSYHTIDAKEAKEMMETQDVIILDVRSEEEYQEAHIPNAQLLPLNRIEKQAQAAIQDKTAILLVYCRSRNRSAKAAQILAKLGYENVYDFGGIQSWPYAYEK